jgi:hypothetical protein
VEPRTKRKASCCTNNRSGGFTRLYNLRAKLEMLLAASHRVPFEQADASVPPQPAMTSAEPPSPIQSRLRRRTDQPTEPIMSCLAASITCRRPALPVHGPSAPGCQGTCNCPQRQWLRWSLTHGVVLARHGIVGWKTRFRETSRRKTVLKTTSSISNCLIPESNALFIPNSLASHSTRRTDSRVGLRPTLPCIHSFRCRNRHNDDASNGDRGSYHSGRNYGAVDSCGVD